MQSTILLDVQFWFFNAVLLVLTLVAGGVFIRQRRSTVTTAFALLLVLATGAVAAASFVNWQDEWLRWLFELDEDMNVPALFAAAQWFMVAVLFMLVGLRFSKPLVRGYLWLTALLFVAISIDDFFALHELEVVDWRWLYFQLGIVFGLITLAVAWVALRHEVRQHPLPFTVAFIGFVMLGISGFLVEEPLLRACIDNRDGFLCSNFHRLTRIEEVFELMGVNVLLVGLLLYAERIYPPEAWRRLPAVLVGSTAAYVALVMVYLLPLPALEVRALTDAQPIPYQNEPFKLRGAFVQNRAYQPGDRVPMLLYWHTDAQPEHTYHLSVHLVDNEGESVASTEEYLLGELPSDVWVGGMTVRKFAMLRLPEDIDAPASYWVGVRVWRGSWLEGWQNTSGLLPERQPSQIAEDMVSVGQVSVLPPGSRASGGAADGFDFGGQIVLDDFYLPGAAHPGDTIGMAFTWQPTARLSAAYSQFLHFFHTTESDTYFVADREPFAGEFPTTAWQPGHVVQDCFTYTIPADVQPGTYNFHTGLYHTETGDRLSVTNLSGDTIPDASLPLQHITIVEPGEPLPTQSTDDSGCGE